MSEEMERLITVKEAAKRLGLTDWTIRNQIREGRLPGLQVGRYYRVDWAAVERLIEARATSWRGNL